MKFEQVNLDRPLDKDLENATQINLGDKIGITVTDNLIDFNNGGYKQHVMCDNFVPMGVKVITLPTIGDSKKGTSSGYTDAINKYYTNIREQNSSLAAYNPLDVFKFSYAVSNINVLSDVIRRKIRALFLDGKQCSINFRRGILALLYVNKLDWEDAQNNSAIYITKYNSIVKSASQIVFPKQFAINSRYHKLFSRLYAEDPDMYKSQMISFEPYGVWRIDVNPSSPTVGQFYLETTYNKTLTQLLDLLRDMINDLGNDTDNNNIMAEIAKAVKSDCYKLTKLEIEPKEVEIKFSLDVLDLTRNATYVGGLADVADQRIQEINTGNYPYLTHYNANANYSADPENLYISGNYNLSGASYPYIDTRNIRRPVHSHADAPDNITAYNITAGIVNIYNYPLNPNPHVLDFCTEVFLTYTTYEYLSDTQTFRSYNFISFYQGMITQWDITRLHSFSSAPDVICYGFNPSDVYETLWVHSDIDNISFVPSETIAATQSVALQCSLVYEAGSPKPEE